MNKKLKVGVIGAGRIGQVHAEHLAHRIAGASLEAIADINATAAQQLAQRLNVPHATGDYKELLKSGVDAVVICSSTDTHARIIEEAALSGKHIFCEKPVDHDLAKIDRALAAVEKAKLKLQIGFNRRFDPNFRHVKEVLETGGIGQLHILRITSRDPAPPPPEYVKVSGGLFLDMTIHDFDMARYLTASEVESVYAVGGVKVDPRIGAAGDIDTAVITLSCKNGAIVTIDNSRQAKYGYDQRVEAFGSEGMIAAENNTAHRTLLANQQGIHQPVPLAFFMDRYTDSYINEMREFVDAVQQDKPCPVIGNDGRAPVVIALAARKSLAEQRAVRLSEVEQPALAR